MSHIKRSPINVGDRVITHNSKFGTVVRVDHDALGDFIVVRLDSLKGEFAYDPWDIKKL